MEENYRPDGWLGIILETKLWMNFEKDPQKGMEGNNVCNRRYVLKVHKQSSCLSVRQLITYIRVSDLNF